jgi:hypothetical protein
MESTESEEDLLSELPSDILVSILEKLAVRDAVRVGVLSRRWRRLPAQLPRLDLDIDCFLPGDASEFHDHADDGQDPADDEEEGVVQCLRLPRWTTTVSTIILMMVKRRTSSSTVTSSLKREARWLT